MSQILDFWKGLSGVILPYAGANPPPGWLYCSGQDVSRTTYAELFAAIGTTFGAGDGSTTFTLPDTRGRVIAGVDNMGGTPANRLTTAGSGINATMLGSSGGAQNHTLTAAQMPAHNHGVNDPGHAHNVYDPTHTHGVYDPGHVHSYNRVTTGNGQGSDIGTANNHVVTNTAAATTGISLHAAATGIGIYAAATGISTQNAGSGSAHNNMQPTIVMHHIIKI